MNRITLGFAVVIASLSHIEAEGMNRNIHLRGSLKNSRITFEKTGKGHVAFMGGSITQMEGYRPMVAADLQKRFPKTKFTFTSAGISSTCSTSGAFRLEEHVLKTGPVDLFFVEFAVNDDQDAGHARRECMRGMEGIIRHARKYNPNMDIVITHFVNPGMLRTLQGGKEPLSMDAHETVAKHYDVSVIHLAQELADRIAAGTMTWKEFGGTHPHKPGNRLCADLIDELFTKVCSEELQASASPMAHSMPDEPLDANHYGDGHFVDIKSARLDKGWRIDVPEWKKIKGSSRSQFVKLPILSTETAGSELSLEFEGKAIGAYILAGPDAGIVESSIDGGPFKKTELFHRFSRGLHYPRTVMFEADLKSGKHTLKLRMSTEHNKTSIGTAMRIMAFAVN